MVVFRETLSCAFCFVLNLEPQIRRSALQNVCSLTCNVTTTSHELSYILANTSSSNTSLPPSGLRPEGIKRDTADCAFHASYRHLWLAYRYFDFLDVRVSGTPVEVTRMSHDVQGKQRKYFSWDSTSHDAFSRHFENDSSLSLASVSSLQCSYLGSNFTKQEIGNGVSVRFSSYEMRPCLEDAPRCHSQSPGMTTVAVRSPVSPFL